jgi:hypothetical protein
VVDPRLVRQPVSVHTGFSLRDDGLAPPSRPSSPSRSLNLCSLRPILFFPFPSRDALGHSFPSAPPSRARAHMQPCFVASTAEARGKKQPSAQIRSPRLLPATDPGRRPRDSAPPRRRGPPLRLDVASPSLATRRHRAPRS